MIKDAKNKAMQPEDIENKAPAAPKQSGKEEYHFAGEGKYQPHTVLAGSATEAQEIWEKERKEV